MKVSYGPQALQQLNDIVAYIRAESRGRRTASVVELRRSAC